MTRFGGIRDGLQVVEAEAARGRHLDGLASSHGELPFLDPAGPAIGNAVVRGEVVEALRRPMAVEVARGKKYFPGWNVARWWLSHEAHQRDPQRFLANFEAGLGIFAEHGILVMPILFNRWRDPVCDFGGVPLDHLIPHHSAWTGVDDLFVNPDAGNTVEAPVQGLFYRYLTDVAAVVYGIYLVIPLFHGS